MTPDQALAAAYRYLGRRERTVAETRTHLFERGASADVAEAAIVALSEQGYVDDRRFARVFVEDKRTLEQWGEERIRRGLEAHGVSRELADEAIGAGWDRGAELDRAVALLRRRMPNPERGRRARERALGVLLRRGYEYEVADEAVRRCLAEAPRASTLVECD